MYQKGTLEDIREFFNKPFPAYNQEMSLMVDKITLKQKEFEEFPERFDIQLLLKHRILASNSLRRGDGLMQWEQASQYVARQVFSGEDLNTAQLLKINSLLANEQRSWRETKMYTADEEYLPPENLQEFKAYFDEKLPLYKDRSLLQAFLAYCWTVTLHGFSNQNGRTARLAGDWILLQSGYIPMYFSSSVSSHVAQTINGYKRTLEDGFLKFLAALVEGYEVMRLKS